MASTVFGGISLGNHHMRAFLVGQELQDCRRVQQIGNLMRDSDLRIYLQKLSIRQYFSELQVYQFCDGEYSNESAVPGIIWTPRNLPFVGIPTYLGSHSLSPSEWLLRCCVSSLSGFDFDIKFGRISSNKFSEVEQYIYMQVFLIVKMCVRAS